MLQCLALVRNYIPLSSCLSLRLYICDRCHCGATDNSEGNNLKRLELKKWLNNVRTSRQISAMSNRQQSLGGSSMADYQLSCLNRFSHECERRSKSSCHKGLGATPAKIGMHSKTVMHAVQKLKPLFVGGRTETGTNSDLNSLIMTLANVEYFHVRSP